MTFSVARLYPFVPSGPDFARALQFFTTIGFEISWRQAGLAGLRLGGAYFILQEIHVPAWQKNQMLTIEVSDLDEVWAVLSAANLAVEFPEVRLKAPTDYAWGREIHFIDPAGVCWHVRQSPGSGASIS